MSPHQSSFWRVVYDCLLEFHGFEPGAAQRTIRDYRLKLEGIRGSAAELIYHHEPFYLAAELARHKVREPEGEEIGRYEAMLKRRTEEASALGTDEEVVRLAKRRKAA